MDGANAVPCRAGTDYETLNQVFKRMGKNQHELLRILNAACGL
jgi:hypothetical protein